MADDPCFWLVATPSGRACVNQKGTDKLDIPDWETVVGFTCDWAAVMRWVNEGQLPHGG